MTDARNVLHVSLFVPEAAGEAGARVVASVKIDPKLEPLGKRAAEAQSQLKMRRALGTTEMSAARTLEWM